MEPGEAKFLRSIIAAHPRKLTRADVAERAGISPTSSNVGRFTKTLVKLGIVEERDGYVHATARLFPAEVAT